MARNFRLLTKVFGAVALVALTCSPAIAGLSFPAAAKKDGSPDRRRGAGSRGIEECRVDKAKSPFAIAPDSNVSLTTQARPDFFWYMPATTTGTVIFKLEGDGELLYRTEFQADGQEGIAQLSLPSGIGAVDLQAGKSYRWSVELNCDIDNPESVKFAFSSTINRQQTSPELSSQLKVASSLNQAELYAENGIWMDSLSALVDLQCDPAMRDEGLAAWSALLKSVDLEFFTQIPMLGDCDCDCK